MVPILRRLGIALGSLVIAWLAVSLVAGAFLGSGASGSYLVPAVAIVVGGLVYRDILRREMRA